MPNVPEIVFLDAANRPHFSNFGSRADNLDADVRSGLDDGVLVVGALRRRGIGIPFDIARDKLYVVSQPDQNVSRSTCRQMVRTCAVTKSRRGAGLGEEALWVDGVYHRIDLFDVRHLSHLQR